MKIIDDFKTINELNNNQIDFLIKELSNNSLDDLESIALFEDHCLNNDIEIDIARSFVQIISFVCDYLIEQKSINEGLRDFEEKVINAFNLDKLNVWIKIKNSIDKLKGFIIGRKEYLVSNISNKLSELNLICDIRPVFDVGRNKIEKYYYPIIMSYSTNKSEKVTIELTEEDLDKLKKEVDLAISKLNIIKENLK